MLSAYLSILGLHDCPYNPVLELLTAADVDKKSCIVLIIDVTSSPVPMVGTSINES